MSLHQLKKCGKLQVSIQVIYSQNAATCMCYFSPQVCCPSLVTQFMLSMLQSNTSSLTLMIWSEWQSIILAKITHLNWKMVANKTWHPESLCSNNRYDLGTPIFLGWVGSGFHMTGGFFYVWSVCTPLCGGEHTWVQTQVWHTRKKVRKQLHFKLTESVATLPPIV